MIAAFRYVQCTTFSRLALGTELRRLNGLRHSNVVVYLPQSGDRLWRGCEGEDVLVQSGVCIRDKINYAGIQLCGKNEVICCFSLTLLSKDRSWVIPDIDLAVYICIACNVQLCSYEVQGRTLNTWTSITLFEKSIV